MDWRARLSRGSVRGFLSYDEANEILNYFLFRFPEMLSRQLIGQSFESREMYAYRMSFSRVDSGSARVLLTSVMHGREPVTLSVALNAVGTFLEAACEPTSDEAYILRTREMYIIPFMNPDAYAAASACGDFVYRKNRRPTCPANSEMGGVDLNRNFDYKWSNATDPCGLEYGGTAPFSEPETRALKDFVEHKGFVSAMHLHSYGEILTYPFNARTTDTLKPQHSQFYDELQAVFKFNRVGPSQQTLQYETLGESDDWFYGKLGVVSMSPEIGPEADGFTPSTNTVQEMMIVNYHRIKYWIFKSGYVLTISTRSRGLEISNSGLSPFSGSFEVIFSNATGKCSDNLTRSIPGLGSRVLLGSSCEHSVSYGTVCLNENGNCRCVSVSNSSTSSVEPGVISSSRDFPNACGLPRVSALPSLDVSSTIAPALRAGTSFATKAYAGPSAWTAMGVFASLLLTGVILVLVIRRQISRTSGVYIPVSGHLKPGDGKSDRGTRE